MVAIVILGIVAFLILLVSHQGMRAGGTGRAATYRPQWYEVLLGAGVLAVAAGILLWQFPPWSGGAAAEGRSTTFFVIMLIAAGAGVVVFVLAMLWRLMRDRDAEPEPGTVAAPAPAEATPRQEAKAAHHAPSGIRLLGLVAFGIGFLMLNWSHVPVDQQKQMMLNLIYPAGLIVALVMMFDKASRAWDVKAPGEGVREWLFLNIFMFLYLLGYLNLLGAQAGQGYGGMFWDFLHVAMFLLILWIVDRTTTRLRFLIAHAWLIALPVLLLIWQAQMGVPAVEGVGWWQTIWPFFFLGIVFFVVELIVLIAGGGAGAGTAKDLVFLVLYVILLIAARPEAVAS